MKRLTTILLCLAACSALATDPLQLYPERTPGGRGNWVGIAGVPGGIPSRTTIYTTLSPGANIQTAINNCPSNQVVLLNPGTYTADVTILKNGVTLRGSGPTTIINGTITIGDQNAWFGGGNYARTPSQNGVQNWTAGYAQGTYTITLASTSGYAAGQTIFLDQNNDADTTQVGPAGYTCCEWVSDAYPSTGQDRTQFQVNRIASISGNNVTLTEPIYAPNWNAALAPRAFRFTVLPTLYSGVENLKCTYRMRAQNCYGCWMSNLQLQGGSSDVHTGWMLWQWGCLRCTVNHCYIYTTSSGAGQDLYGIQLRVCAGMLIEDNAMNWCGSGIMPNGCSGSVIAYNWMTNNVSGSSYMTAGLIMHGGFPNMNLWEGNLAPVAGIDNTWGGSGYTTLLRNRFVGRPYGANGLPTSSVYGNIDAIQDSTMNRHVTVLGNVAGTVGYNTYYQDAGSGGCHDGGGGETTNLRVYSIGYGGGCGGTFDATTLSTLIRAYNWTTAGGITADGYTSADIPASLYLTSKPAFFGNLAWPAVDPDNPTYSMSHTNIPAGYRFRFNAEPPSGGAASDYYVATTGSDSNPGTQAQPFKSIQAAYSAATNGNTIHVANGTYTNRTVGYGIRLNKVGITLKADNKLGAVLDMQNAPNGNQVLYIDGANNTVDGFVLTGGTNGGVSIWSDNTTIRNCEICTNGITDGGSANGQDGLYSNYGTTGGSYQNNLVHDNGRPGSNLDHGFYLCGTNEMVFNNALYRNAAAGLQIAGYDSIAGMRVYNNVMAWNGRTGITLWQDFTSCDIKNNVLYQNGSYGIHAFAATGSGVTITNNLFYGNTDGTYSFSDGGSTVIYGIGGSISNSPPGFVTSTQAGFDPHLAIGSACIGAGLNLSSYFNTDLAGALRTVPWDIGVYEYVGQPTVLGMSFLATNGVVSGGFSTTNGVLTTITGGVMSGTNAFVGQGLATYIFTNPVAGDYVLWATNSSPNWQANSLYVGLSDYGNPGEPKNVWNTDTNAAYLGRMVSWQGSGTTNSPQWNPWVITNLTAAQHTLIVRGKDIGEKVLAWSFLPAPTNPVAPTIVTSPQSQTVVSGTNVTLTVVATGDLPLIYLWNHAGTNIATATASSLGFTASAATAGDYFCGVTNLGGGVVSATATITVTNAPVAPVFTLQPVSQTVTQGGSATFTNSATGTTPMRYTWRFNGVTVASSTAIKSFTTNGVTTNSAGSYSVVVTNVAGSITSSPAILTVLVPPWITVQPQGQTIVSNGNATFTVTAAGVPAPGYQWHLGGVDIAGATTSSYTTNNVVAGGTYSVTINNSSGTVLSSNAVLNVTNAVVAPAITVQPASRTNVVGTDAAFSVTASGTTLAYQWQFNSSPIAGATLSGYTRLGVAAGDAGSYRVVVTNSAGAATSSVASLVVVTAPAITSQPASRTNTQGSTATFTVTASGTAPLSYQWWTNGVLAAGATSSGFSVQASINNAGTYQVVVTNAYGSVTSSVANLTVIVAPYWVVQQGGVAPRQGTTVTLSSLAAGSPDPAYRWRYNGTPLVDGGRVSGSGTATMAITGVVTNDSGQYTLVCTNAGGAITSFVVYMVVTYPPVITSSPTNTTVVWGNFWQLSGLAQSVFGVGYQWQKNGSTVTGLDNTIGSYAAVSDAGTYTLIATNVGGSVTSSPAILNVIVPPTTPRTLHIIP